TLDGAALFVGKVIGKTTVAVFDDVNGKPGKKITEATLLEDIVPAWQPVAFKPIVFGPNTSYFLVWQSLGGEQPPLAAQGAVATVSMLVSLDGGLTWSNPNATPVKLKVFCN